MPADRAPKSRPARRAPAGTMTVADVASRFGVSSATVLAWIRAGELLAVNVSRSAASAKPRWRITAAALEAFEARRAATPVVPRTTRRRKAVVGDPIQFYQ